MGGNWTKRSCAWALKRQRALKYWKWMTIAQQLLLQKHKWKFIFIFSFLPCLFICLASASVFCKKFFATSNNFSHCFLCNFKLFTDRKLFCSFWKWKKRHNSSVSSFRTRCNLRILSAFSLLFLSQSFNFEFTFAHFVRIFQFLIQGDPSDIGKKESQIKFNEQIMGSKIKISSSLVWGYFWPPKVKCALFGQSSFSAGPFLRFLATAPP